MTTNIAEILNPVRLLTVDEWMKVSEIQHKKNKFNPITPIQLIKRYEELTQGKWRNNAVIGGQTPIKYHWIPALLTKSMFVCEVQRPEKYSQWYMAEDIQDIPKNEQKLCLEYTQAQEHLIFEGFESISKSEVKILLGANNTPFKVDIQRGMIFISFFLQNPICLRQATVFDFIYQIDRYNRTATNKINNRYTEQFIRELLK